MDVLMPGLDGLGASRALLVDDPATRVLLITGSVHAAGPSALAAGAFGYLEKSAGPDELIRCIR